MRSSKQRREVERVKKLVVDLVAEEKDQTQNVGNVQAWLKAQSKKLIPKPAKDVVLSTSTILQRMFLPRCMFSADDALFAARFAEVLHRSSVPNWNT